VLFQLFKTLSFFKMKKFSPITKEIKKYALD